MLYLYFTSGTRLSTIYDVRDKTFLLKLGKSEAKYNVVIESGARIHLTKYTRQRTENPSQFVTKLRKFLNDKSLNLVEQLGLDRIVHFQFGTGSTLMNLYVELFGQVIFYFITFLG